MYQTVIPQVLFPAMQCCTPNFSVHITAKLGIGLGRPQCSYKHSTATQMQAWAHSAILSKSCNGRHVYTCAWSHNTWAANTWFPYTCDPPHGHQSEIQTKIVA